MMADSDTAVLKNLSALYVEDDDATRVAMTEFLRDVLGEVYEASDAPYAFDLFEQKHPDIVIADIELGEMNGFELTRAIKNISPQTPVIIISAHDAPAYIETAKELYVHSFLVKPVDYQKLLDAIHESIQKSDIFSELGEGGEILHFLLDENPRFAIEYTKNRLTYINASLLRYIGYESFDLFCKEGAQFGSFLRTRDGSEYEEYARENWAHFVGKNGSELYISNHKGKINRFFAYSREFFEGKKRVIFLDNRGI